MAQKKQSKEAIGLILEKSKHTFTLSFVMNKFVLLLLIFTLPSCGLHSDGIDVLVKNNTEKNIENARFRALYSELEIGEISPRAKFKGYLDMSEEHRIDGGYLLIFENKIGEEISVDAY